MKNFKKSFALVAGVAALALVGTGYAAWTFSKDATANFDGSVSIVEKATEVGELKVKDGTTVKLVLDQKEDGGVYWATNAGDALDKITLEYTGANKVVNETIEVSVTPSYTGKLAEYVTFGDFAAVEAQTWTGGTTALAFDFTLPTVAYTDRYPLNEAAYDTMVTDLASATISFAFSAAVAECTH